LGDRKDIWRIKSLCHLFGGKPEEDKNQGGWANSGLYGKQL